MTAANVAAYTENLAVGLADDEAFKFGNPHSPVKGVLACLGGVWGFLLI